jgi:hypothetical protein
MATFLILIFVAAIAGGAGWYVGRHGFHGAWAALAAVVSGVGGTVAAWLGGGGPTP